MSISAANTLLLVTAYLILGGMLTYVFYNLHRFSELRKRAERERKDKKEQSVLTFSESVERQVKAMLAFNEAVDRLAKVMETIPVLVEGLEAMAKHQADMLDQLRRGMDLLHGALHAPGEGGDDDDGQQVASREEAEIREILRKDKGLNREQAEGRVREADFFRQMLKGR